MAWRFPSVVLLEQIAVVLGSLGATVAGVVAFGELSQPSWLVVLARVAMGAGELGFLASRHYVRGWIRAVAIDQWRAIDRETDRTAEQAGATSMRVLAVLVTCAVVLTLQEYVGGSDKFDDWFPKVGGEYRELYGF